MNHIPSPQPPPTNNKPKRVPDPFNALSLGIFIINHKVKKEKMQIAPCRRMYRQAKPQATENKDSRQPC
ncbi:hypothetical protein EYC84_009817 [Monilinia fructicola]|uniref:Uncharacterized protein n=1 Tax=Monilinia fructicola TaxID=38448 RepID=A0A5M9JB74_MONFR|nr:hypothetical protein EYC84_009817 [Monilinia fructicola]